MGWASFRLTPEDRKKLHELAEKKGMTISEVIRDMIRHGYEQIAVSTVSEKIDKLLVDLSRLQKVDARTLHIVTLLANANPSTSKLLSESQKAEDR